MTVVNARRHATLRPNKHNASFTALGGRRIGLLLYYWMSDLLLIEPSSLLWWEGPVHWRQFWPRRLRKLTRSDLRGVHVLNKIIFSTHFISVNWPHFIRAEWAVTGRSHGELGRCAAHDPVPRGRNQTRALSWEKNWGQPRLGQTRWSKVNNTNRRQSTPPDRRDEIRALSCRAVWIGYSMHRRT